MNAIRHERAVAIEHAQVAEVRTARAVVDRIGQLDAKKRLVAGRRERLARREVGRRLGGAASGDRQSAPRRSAACTTQRFVMTPPARRYGRHVADDEQQHAHAHERHDALDAADLRQVDEKQLGDDDRRATPRPRPTRPAQPAPVGDDHRRQREHDQTSDSAACTMRDAHIARQRPRDVGRNDAAYAASRTSPRTAAARPRRRRRFAATRASSRPARRRACARTTARSRRRRAPASGRAD